MRMARAPVEGAAAAAKEPEARVRHLVDHDEDRQHHGVRSIEPKPAASSTITPASGSGGTSSFLPVAGTTEPLGKERDPGRKPEP